MPRIIRFLFALAILALLIGAPIAYAWYWQNQIRNLRVVRDGVLYRSGQMTPFGLKQVVQDYHIKTVISLRHATRPGDPPPDLQEEEFCKKEGIRYIRIFPRSWESSDGAAPAEDGIRTFCEIMANPANHPVLIHCFAGIHRTGAYCAIYRMEFEFWSNADAMAELRSCGYSHLDEELDIWTFLERYQASWKLAVDPRAEPSEPALHLPEKPLKHKVKKIHASQTRKKRP